MEDNHIYKSLNKTLLMVHMVFPVKYRRSVISEEVGVSLKQIYIEISERYEIHFVEIGYEGGHVHFLIQCANNECVQDRGIGEKYHGERDFSSSSDG